MIKINLLADGKKASAVRRTKTGGGKGPKSSNLAAVFFTGAFLLCLLAFGIYWWTLYSDLRAREAEIKRAKEEVAQLEEIIQKVANFKKKKAELKSKIEVISLLKENQRGPVRVMDEVSKGLPELMWLTKMELTANSVTITGQSFSFNAIGVYIDNLDKVPEFQEPELIDSTRSGDIYNFSLQFGYKPVTQGGQLATAEGDTPPAGDVVPAAE